MAGDPRFGLFFPPSMWLADIFLSACVPAVATALGWPAVALWQKTAPCALDRASSLAGAFACGLLYVQTGAMVLAAAGALTATWVAAWMGMGLLTAALGIARLRLRPSRPTASPAFAATAVLFAFYLLMATVPPWYRDEMVYHLALPRAFAASRGYVRPDDLMYSAMPMGWESILAALHTFGAAPDRFPPFNPRLVGAWTTLAAAISTVGLARTLGVAERLATWAAPLVLLVPTFIEFGPSAYNEPFLVLLSSLALIATLRYAGGDTHFLLPAGLFAGAAASVKYPGLALGTFFGLLIAVTTTRREGRFKAYRATAFFFGVAALLGSIFYLRNWVQRSNPIFPLAYLALGGTGWDDWRDQAYTTVLRHFGAGRTTSDYFALPFRMFTTRDLSMGFEGSLGPVLGLGGVAAIVLPFLHSKDRRAISTTALLVAFWGLFWALTTQQLRFFLVAVPALVALLLRGAVAIGGRPGWQRLLIAACLVGALSWTLPLARHLWKHQRTTDWLLGRIDRDALLREMLPESYALEPDLEAFVPPQGRIWLVWMRNYTYYLRRPFKQDSVFEAYRFEALLDEAQDDAAVVSSLKADGITHLLIHHAFFLWNDNADLRPGRTRRIRERFASLGASGAFRALHSWGRITLYEVVTR